jgi:hypothetical protein
MPDSVNFRQSDMVVVKKSSFFIKLGITAWVLIGIFHGYLFYQGKELVIKKQTLATRIINLDREIKNKKEKLGNVLISKEILSRVVDFRTNWQKPLSDILSLFGNGIEIKNVNSKRDGQNIFTFSAGASDWKAVANFLTKLKEDNRFDDVFISNISEGVLSDERIGLIFDVELTIKEN